MPGSMDVVFLDRDDTLNDDPGYLNDPDRVQLLPGVTEGLRLLADAGYALIVLTNQSGVGRGIILPEQLRAVNDRLFTLLAQDGIHLLDLFFCPHVDEDRCDCRKPRPGLLWQALERYPRINIERSWIMGDRFRDLMPGLTLPPGHTGSIRGVLVGGKEAVEDDAPANLVYRASDLLDAARFVRGSSAKGMWESAHLS